MKSEDIKGLQFHIESDDYFGTLATVLSLLKQNLSKGESLKELDLLDRKVEELMYLQNNYKIAKKYDK